MKAIDPKLFDLPRSPTIDAYIADRIRRKLNNDELLIAVASRPFFARGYRCEEITAEYHLDYGGEFYRLTNVRVVKPQFKVVLALRRAWRRYFPYDPNKGGQ